MAEFISSEKVPKSKILIMIFIKHTLACFMLTKSSRWNRVFIYLIIYCYPERTGNFQEVIYMQLVSFKPFCREIGMFEKKNGKSVEKLF